MNCCQVLLEAKNSLQQILDDTGTYTIAEIEDKISNVITVLNTRMEGYNCE